MILIVDDFRDGGEALCHVLTRLGYPCQWVSSGVEALARIRSHPPEQPLLVILDEMMPDMTGLDTLKQIRDDQRISRTNVIMFSASFDAIKRDQAMVLGVAAWLLKGGAGDAGMNHVLETIKSWYERVGGVKLKASRSTSE